MKETGKGNPLKNRKYQEAAFVGACSAALLVYSLYHHHFDRNVTEWKTSPFLFPTLISVFGLLLVIPLLSEARDDSQAYISEAAKTGGGGPSPASHAKSVLVFIAGAVLYDLLLPAAHFLPATFLFLAGLLWFLGERSILKLILTAACADAAVYVLFGVLLHVRLP